MGCAEPAWSCGLVAEVSAVSKAALGDPAPPAHMYLPRPPACGQLIAAAVNCDLAARASSSPSTQPRSVLSGKPYTFPLGEKAACHPGVCHPDPRGWRCKLLKHFHKSRFGARQRTGATMWDSVVVTRRAMWAGGLPGGGEGPGAICKLHLRRGLFCSPYPRQDPGRSPLLCEQL